MDIRALFLDFFQSKGHQVYASMPLVPDDASLLFTNAGMVQFKDIFVGKIPTPTNPKATSSQLCIRAGGKHNDLENVGFTRRHHTLFEMLGNFSFGDYFKEEAIAYAWEFVTEVLKFDKSVLYVTIHESDDEAFEIWSKHIDPSRIKRMGDKDNFWQMGDTGPCGPCSEIFIDQGEEFSSQEDYFGGEGDRFLEIWNLVFMQYERHADKSLTPLPKPSIDTGMGLERVTALLEKQKSNFDSSIFMPLIKEVEQITQKPYIYEEGASFRVIADHARTTAFLLAQGVNFDKEGRGYVLRRILRRAIRHGYLLGQKQPFVYKVVAKVCEQMGGFYTYLREKQASICEQCRMEEARFFETIEQGITLFRKELARLKDSKQSIFSGAVAFKLYDTFGFPLDLTQDMLKEEQLTLDLQGFEEAMQEQKNLAKSSWKGSGDSIKQGDFKEILQKFGENEFIGYAHTQGEGKILALFDEEFRSIERLESQGYALFEKTPFYPEGGGAIGDKGEGYLEGQKVLEVLDTQKYFGLNISKIQALKPLTPNQTLTLQVSPLRDEITKHHSATHLLHAILREKLGDQIAQAGSLVESNRLRFDFSFPRALTKEELSAIQDGVNALIQRALPAQVEHMPLQEAKDKGAIALFGEKYSTSVRVVSFGEVSCELCGGIHVSNTSQIGTFYILKESGVSSGVRRIEAICGRSAYDYTKGMLDELAHTKDLLKNQDIEKGIQKLKDRIKELEKQLSQSQNNIALEGKTIQGTMLIIQAIGDSDAKRLVDEQKNRYEKIAILLINKETLQIVAGSKNSPLKAGAWAKEVAQILGGNGGGRDDFALAGGKDKSALDAALKRAETFALENL